MFDGVVLDYNFVRDSNLFLKTNMLLKESTTSTLQNFCRSKQNKKVFFEKKNVYLEDEINEGLSWIPNGLRCFCMDLIKEQLLKHWFDLNAEIGPKPMCDHKFYVECLHGYVLHLVLHEFLSVLTYDSWKWSGHSFFLYILSHCPNRCPNAHYFLPFFVSPLSQTLDFCRNTKPRMKASYLT